VSAGHIAESHAKFSSCRCSFFAMVSGTALFAADRGTPAEAKTMLRKAGAHYKSGRAKTGACRFHAKKVPFGDRNLYVVCIAADHTIVANGGFPQYVGASADAVKEADSKSLGPQDWDVVSTKRGRRGAAPLDQSCEPPAGAKDQVLCQGWERCVRSRRLQSGIAPERVLDSQLQLKRIESLP
jgi:hypothetical protein